VLTKEKINALFKALNHKLQEKGEMGEIGIVGGAAMCLVYNVRSSTKDVDAIFEPASTIRKLAAQVAEEQGVDEDWLNDAVKGFLVKDFNRIFILNLSHLKIWTPDSRYLLAMKCMSARWDTHDQDDVKFLIGLLELTKKEQVFELIEAYYPKSQIPAKTQFFIEELLQGKRKKKR